ncbi:MAG TPA: response regulator [Terriglobales bacterium]|nr:response regulator [Terriglobales bacterium]
MKSLESDILLVDDSPDDTDLALMALRKENLANRIVIARDGEEALNFLFCSGAYSGRSFDNPPKVVLLDLKLPKIDGLQVLQKIRNDPRTRSIPVVILTSSKEEQDIVKGYSLGVNSYVQKPVDFDQFRSAVRSLGLYWLVVNQPPISKSLGNV